MVHPGDTETVAAVTPVVDHESVGKIMRIPPAVFDPDRPYPYFWFILVALAAHATFASFPSNPVLGGAVFDTDGYMHMVRARELYESGNWYDHVIERVNAPYGLTLHWTRIIDVFLLGLTFPLTLFANFPSALHWGALVLGPVVHIAAACATAWAARPLIKDSHRLWILPIFFFQGTMLSYSFAGRVDHHGALVLIAALSIGAMLRLLERPHSRKIAIACGIVHGIGFWLSPEFILILIIDLAALSILWALKGEAWNMAAMRLCLGALLAVTVYLPIERAPAELLTVEHDRISIFHAAFLACAVAIWTLSRWKPIRTRSSWRFVYLGTSACVGFLVLLVVFPEFYRGPMAGIDPRIDDLLIDRVGEMKPLVTSNLVGLGRLLSAMGGAIVAIPLGIWVLLRDGKEKNNQLWSYSFGCLIALLILGSLHARLSTYVAIPLSIFVAEFLRRLSHVLASRVRDAWKILIVFYSAMFIGIGPLLAGDEVKSTAVAAHLEMAKSEACGNQEILGTINYALEQMPKHRAIFMTDSMSYGPLIVYFTAAAVVSAPYHRNVRGILDADTFWHKGNDAEAREIIAKRGVNFLIACDNLSAASAESSAQQQRSTLFWRLKNDQDLPDWLTPVALPADLQQSRVRLYRVTLEAGSESASGISAGSLH